MPVDWSSGLRRWGDETSLHRHIERFLERSSAELTNLTELLATAAHEPAMALIHRMRGAAANLSLPTLQSILANAEAALRMQTVPEGLLADIAQQLTDIQQSLGQRNKEDSKRTQTSLQPGPAADALQAALHMLERGEINNSSLQALYSTMPTARAERLRLAIDDFDFELAIHYLQQEVTETSPDAS